MGFQMPDILYKYREFDVRTIQLLTDADIYYAEPRKFNDPLDCAPAVLVDTDVKSVEKLCSEMLRAKHGDVVAQEHIAERQSWVREEYGDYKVDPEAEGRYKHSLALGIASLIRDELGAHGVLSLAQEWNNVLMWSHYAANHEGICIGYDMSENVGSPRPIDYSGPGHVTISELMSWKLDDCVEARDRVFQTFFFEKAHDWEYELEWRCVADAEGSKPAPPIKEVYFGMCCNQAVVTTLVKLSKDLDPEITFYGIRRDNNTFNLERVLLNPEEEAIQVRSSVYHDFDDISDWSPSEATG